MSKYPEGKFDRHTLNVPGPFYVEEGQCINCLGPCEKAPGIIGFFEEPPDLRGAGHCYVKKQPETPEELESLLQAFQASCCSGLRYSGDDPGILKRLTEVGQASRCDELWDDEPAPKAASASQSPSTS